MTAGAAKTELNNGTLAQIPGHIPPTARRGWWIFAGLVLQLAGVGGPAAYVWAKAKHQDVSGLITVATVKLAWHQSLHAKAGVTLLIGGAALFAIGSIALARPFAKHWLTLFVGVPIAALCGALVLGVAALVIALLVFLFLSDADVSNLGGEFGGRSSGKRKDQPEPPPQASPPGS
ncbi:hypothetical protein KGQ20_41540 [Catenulispora sp. NF23]|uniref:hypothetical protein n=1 Tax=Catenulispora pinistramenti TaxID=2705254 RepID=UPI001BA8173D|nr:hypothetical protein [Catenulispora pinistramenti]MBS2539250.1 hypothetical protein [Catenulispora pinistramenti]